MSERPTTDDLFKGDGYSEQKSAGTLMKEVTEDLSRLIRKEIELAKQELGESVGAKVTGMVAIAIVAFLGFFAGIFVLLAIRDLLALVLPTWAADFGTAAILLLIGALAAFFAKRKLSTPISAELTKLSVKEDVETLKSLGRR